MRNYFLMAFCGQYPANHIRNPLADAVDDDDDDDDDDTDTDTGMARRIRASARRQLRD